MPSVSTEAKEIMEKDVEVRRQEQARLRFETRSAALREALQLCERMQDEGMIRTATMQLIAHLQSNPEAQTSASPATPATVTASPATPATTTP
jgi:Arc/MetJ-type ribon-helix-helix transcriptional regulator